MPYQQLTDMDRSAIHALHKADYSQQQIADHIGCHKSTISRELKRNSGQRGYRPKQAHRLACERRKAARNDRTLKMSGALEDRVLNLLHEHWSPEQISGRLKKECFGCISPETIYRYVKADKHTGGQLFRLLRRGHRQRKKRYGSHDRRGQMRNQTSIDERPAIVDERSRIGDWEIDTIVGYQSSGYVVSMVERRSGLTVLGKVPTKCASGVMGKTIDIMNFYKDWIYTITADNGKEFARHEDIASGLKADIYFAHPYHSWERGCNENANGLVRQYLPKQSSFSEVTDEDCQKIMTALNTRPRKRLDWNTPNEVFSQQIGVALLN